MLKTAKNFALCATKKINILTLVLSDKNVLNETKNHNPPFNLNDRSLMFSENIVSKKNVQIIKRKYIMTNIDTQETDYSVYCQSRKR